MGYGLMLKKERRKRMRKKDWKNRVAGAVLAAAMVVSQIGVWNAGAGLP